MPGSCFFPPVKALLIKVTEQFTEQWEGYMDAWFAEDDDDDVWAEESRNRLRTMVTERTVRWTEDPELRHYFLPASFLCLLTGSELSRRINVFNLLLKHSRVWQFVGLGLNISGVAEKNDCC